MQIGITFAATYPLKINLKATSTIFCSMPRKTRCVSTSRNNLNLMTFVRMHHLPSRLFQCDPERQILFLS